MNKLSKTFENKAFIAYITAGDPNLDVTEKTIIKMAEAGADLIEVGIPFSDPSAEGPVIQRASVRALNNKTTTSKVFKMLENVRKVTQVPLAIMTYANIVFKYGVEKFMIEAQQVGIDALILPDVPLEEKDEFEPICNKYDVCFIPFVSPTSEDRIPAIVKDAKGFVYCVSSLGVTGVREKITTDLKSIISNIKQIKDIPCAVGFGISTPEQAKEISAYSDGVIVGSAIVKIVEQYGEAAPEYVYNYVKEMKNAML